MDNFCIMFLSGILLVSAGIDFKRKKIPNLITYPAMVIGLLYHGVMKGADGLYFSMAGLAVGTSIFLLPYLLGGMGAGDAKLMGAVGAVIGAKGVLCAVAFTALVGGLYAVILIVVHRSNFDGFLKKQLTTLWNFVLTRKYIPDPIQKGQKEIKLCYGIAIAVGTGLYMFFNQAEYLIFN